MKAANERFSRLADQASIDRAVAALTKNSITVYVVENGAAARAKALEFLPKGAEVMTMSSMTLEEIGLAKEVDESGRFKSVRERLKTMDDKQQAHEKRTLGAAPDWVVGSAHAVTEDGHVFIASNTGSQLGAYAFGASHVIWVVGTQKIVKDDAEAFQRLYQYTLPLEKERIRKLYNRESDVSKLLIVNLEKTPGRLTVILVKEKLGF